MFNGSFASLAIKCFAFAIESVAIGNSCDLQLQTKIICLKIQLQSIPILSNFIFILLHQNCPQSTLKIYILFAKVTDCNLVWSQKSGLQMWTVTDCKWYDCKLFVGNGLIDCKWVNFATEFDHKWTCS